MKKLLLIPLIMMTCLIGGCKTEGEFIEISEYANIEDKEEDGYFSIKETTTKDYECAVQNIFKKYTSNLTATKRDSFGEEGPGEYVSLSLNADYKNFSYFKIEVYSIGILSTHC